MASKKKSAASARPSGAQPGNRNAFKHGFYAKQYFPLELSDLSTALGEGLTDEIALLRVVSRRVFNYANEHESQTFETWTDCLDTLGAAFVRLATLIRTQLLLGGDKDKFLSEIIEALEYSRVKLGFPDPRKDINANI